MPLGVGCTLAEDENDFSMSHMGYSAVSTYFEPGDDMIVNAFLVEIMGNEAHQHHRWSTLTFPYR